MTANLVEFQQRIALRQIIERRRRQIPAETYQPHPNGQEQFHRAPATLRGLFPGNGFGKTRAMAQEVDAWCRHTHRWQRTPDWPILAVWFAKQRTQIEILRSVLEVEVFGPRVRFRTSPTAHYEWEDGSQLWMASADRQTDWKRWQGIPVDLVLFDEQPPLGLWREMRARKRGARDTRYIIAATMTEGITWCAKEFYEPWKRHHLEAGVVEEWISEAHWRYERVGEGDGVWIAPEAPEASDMNLVNDHPEMWLWTRGGVHDNPVVTDSQVRFHERQRWTSPKERRVRLFGGFESWVGDPVFDEDCLADMREVAEAMVATRGARQSGRLVGVR